MPPSPRWSVRAAGRPSSSSRPPMRRSPPASPRRSTATASVTSAGRCSRSAERAGLEVVREYTGHAIGQAMHEQPSIPNFGQPGAGARLRVGNVLAIEPMLVTGSPETDVLDDDWSVVTSDGSWAAHAEHTVAITPDGPGDPDGPLTHLVSERFPRPIAFGDGGPVRCRRPDRSRRRHPALRHPRPAVERTGADRSRSSCSGRSATSRSPSPSGSTRTCSASTTSASPTRRSRPASRGPSSSSPTPPRRPTASGSGRASRCSPSTLRGARPKRC